MFPTTLISLRIVALASTGFLASCSLLFDQTAASSDGGTGVVPDAMPDADAPSLTPFFTLLPIECGSTKITPTNISIALDSGAPAVSRYRWTLEDPSGVEVLNLVGSPDSALVRAARVLDGTYGQPELNLTLYRGSKLGLFTRTSPDKTPSLLQIFDLMEGEYELEAVVGLPDSQKFDAHLRQPGMDGISYSEVVPYDCVIGDTCGTLQYTTFKFPTKNISGSVSNGMLQFVFYTQNVDYYIDAIRLRAVPNGANIVLDSSFDDISSWEVGNPGSGSLQSVPIPDNWTAYGEYKLSLQAIDVNATEGPVVTRTVVHMACN